MRGLKGRHVVVTGGGSGIGRAICQRFGGEGSLVSIFDLAEDKASQTAMEINAAGGRAKAYRVDITDQQAVVAADRLGVEENLLAGGRHAAQRLGTDRQPVSHPGRLDHDVIGAPDQDLSADRGDQLATRRDDPDPARAASVASLRPAVPPWQIATARASAA